MRKAFGILALAVVLAAGCKADKLPFTAQVVSYDGNRISGTTAFCDGRITLGDGAVWQLDVTRKRVVDEDSAVDYNLVFTLAEGEMNSAGVAVQFIFDGWNTDNYVFAPAALYDGNRFHVISEKYPPFIYDPADRQAGMPVTITDVPHLNEDFSDAKVEMLTNNCATPLVGFFDKHSSRGFFLQTVQDTVHGNSSIIIEEHPSEKLFSIMLGAPGVRELRYSMCEKVPSDDKAADFKAGDSIEMNFRVYDFKAGDLMSFFDKFLDVRKALTGPTVYVDREPFSSIAETILAHEDSAKWYEDDKFGYVCNIPQGDLCFGHLQLGWNGAPVYTLMQLDAAGDALAERTRRACRTFDSIEYMQGASGLFYAMNRRGELIGDNFKESLVERDVAMIRRTAITIYYGLQSLEQMRANGDGGLIKPSWESMIRKACDALVTLWGRYGEFGQMIKADTGEIYTPNSTGGALCPAALAYASRYFDEPSYMALAQESARWYFDRQLSKGYSGGGPAEILECPDSESCAELIESYMALYEMTRDAEWLGYARAAAALFSSWVISYDYAYPETCRMYDADVRTTGAVWASVQNEHGAPGIYVMSGDFLLKLFRVTGDGRYLELLKDIIHNVVQYVNTEGHPIQCVGAGIGNVAERVNISDWEGDGEIGCVHFESNQAWENVTLYSVTQNPGIYVQPDSGVLCVFDHVTAKVLSSDADGVTLEIGNNTYRDASVSVLCETAAHAAANSLGWHAYHNWPHVDVAAGAKVTVKIPVTD